MSRAATVLFTARLLAIAMALQAQAVWAQGMAMPPPAADAVSSVGVATATKGNLTVVLTGLGTVTSLQMVTVRSLISGYLQALPFTEGQMVKKGDIIAHIDPRPYEALLAQYEGTLQKDQALLKNSQLDLVRYRKLNSLDSISRQNVDTQASTVQQYEGTVAADQALVDSEKLNIAYCSIVSPVTGRIGLRQIDVGNYVTAGDTNGLVVVVQMQPISVLFTLPEDDLPRVSRRLQDGVSLAVQAFERTDRTMIASGTLVTFDSQIDTTTGTIKLRAIFDNADDSLFPNQFVNARLALDSLSDVVTIPTAAIQHGTPGAYVYIMDGDDKVKLAIIDTGEAHDGRTAVLQGLKNGDRVVVDGLDHLHNGSTVKIVADTPAPRTRVSARTALSDRAAR
jgi:multidrug efflux system membrane fusion protein